MVLDYTMTLIIIISIIINIAYLTLYERKLLAIGQKRIGPNIVGYYGLLQPLYDGVKLILNETILPIKANIIQLILSPLWLLFITLILWIVIPFDINVYIYNYNYDLLYIFALSSLTIYGILYGGYFSHSKYSFISTLRATSQLISYEISIGLLFLPTVILNSSLNLYIITYNQIIYNNLTINIIPYILIFISILAETNRTPFDLLEAESELVAGYLTEYSSLLFVYYYLSEYAMILLWSFLLHSLFNIHYIINISLFIIIRGILPRFKYNTLILLGWYIILPITILYLFFFILLLIYVI